MASPRRLNTEALCRAFTDEAEKHGAEIRYTALTDKRIAPCLGCYKCQQVTGEYGCVQHDDMYSVVNDVIWADCLVLATPIYSWYCTAEMKAVLDRFYGMNKFYGSGEGSLWKGKSVAIIATHGYDRAYATEPFETGIRRLCEHSSLKYLGMYSVRDLDDLASFKTEEAQYGAREFARRVLFDADSAVLRPALRADIEQLTKLRTDFVASIRSIPDIAAFEAATRAYFEANIASDGAIAFVADCGGSIVATSMACVYSTAPLARNIRGITAELLNVYTLPEARRHGLASRLTSLTIEEARRRGVGKLWLEYTDDGRPLYEKLGFTDNGRIMELRL